MKQKRAMPMTSALRQLRSTVPRGRLRQTWATAAQPASISNVEILLHRFRQRVLEVISDETPRPERLRVPKKRLHRGIANQIEHQVDAMVAAEVMNLVRKANVDVPDFAG